MLGLSTLGSQPSSSIQSGAPAAGGSKTQTVAFTLDSIAAAVLQSLQHGQSGGITLDSIQSSAYQASQHSQVAAFSLGDVSIASSQANTGPAIGNSQSIAFTLDGISIASAQTAQHVQSSSSVLGDVSIAVSQTDRHSQSTSFTLGDISASSSQIATHSQSASVALDSVQVSANQSIASAPKPQSINFILDGIGSLANQIVVTTSVVSGGGPGNAIQKKKRKGWANERAQFELSNEVIKAKQVFEESADETIQAIVGQIDDYTHESEQFEALQIEFALLQSRLYNDSSYSADLRQAALTLQEFIQDEQDAIDLLILMEDFDARCVITATTQPFKVVS